MLDRPCLGLQTDNIVTLCTVLMTHALYLHLYLNLFHILYSIWVCACNAEAGFRARYHSYNIIFNIRYKKIDFLSISTSLIFFDNFVEDFVWRIGCRDLIVYSICLSFIQLIVVIFSSLNGFLQGWDFESINTAIGNDSHNRFEMEPINEMMVGHNVSLSFAVKSSLPDSFTWFAQVSLKFHLTKFHKNLE